MLKFTIKYEQQPEGTVTMGELMTDLVSIVETGEDEKRKPAVLQFEDIDIGTHSVTFCANDRWDSKENLIQLIKDIEAFKWVHAVISVKREKKT